MNTSTQLEELVGAWTNLQHEFWDNCLQSKSSSNKSEWESACKRPLEITQGMVSGILQTQAKFFHDAMRYASPEFSESEIIDQYFESVQEMFDSGIESEGELLENWFSILKEFEKQASFAPIMQWYPMPKNNPVADWNKAMNNVFQVWENAAEKTLDAQNKFVSHLTPVEKIGTAKSEKSRSEARKSTATNATKHQTAA